MQCLTIPNRHSSKHIRFQTTTRLDFRAIKHVEIRIQVPSVNTIIDRIENAFNASLTAPLLELP
jgi:hypothetical protein